MVSIELHVVESEKDLGVLVTSKTLSSRLTTLEEKITTMRITSAE